jgi:hypothetical protein
MADRTLDLILFKVGDSSLTQDLVFGFLSIFSAAPVVVESILEQGRVKLELGVWNEKGFSRVAVEEIGFDGWTEGDSFAACLWAFRIFLL